MGRDIQYAQIAGPTVVVWQVIQYLRTPHSHLHNKQEIAMSCAPGKPRKTMCVEEYSERHSATEFEGDAHPTSFNVVA